MKTLIINYPKHMNMLDFKSTDKKHKSFIRLCNRNGHYWLEHHNSKGKLEYIDYPHHDLPRYVKKLIQSCEHYLNQLFGK